MNPAPYELLCRHPQLFDATCLVIGTGAAMPAEWVQIMRNGQTRFQTWDWMTHRHACSVHLDSHFGVPGLEEEPMATVRTAILIWPKSKELGLLLSRYLAQQVDQLWIVGANDAGGKSIGNACKRIDIRCHKFDAARHCSLWQADTSEITHTSESSTIWAESTRYFHAQSQTFATLPGVFSHGQLDKGTALLLDVLTRELTIKPASVLDLGCGAGVIGLTLKQRFQQAQVTLADTDAMALHSSQTNRQSLFPEASDIHVLASDRFSDVSGRYQLIVTNPPFHTGIDTDYRFAQDLFSHARQHLTRNGQLWIVANRHLPYEEWAAEHFGKDRITLHQQASGFKVLQVVQPG